MIRSEKDKEAIIDQLQLALQKGHRLRMSLRIRGEEKAASRVKTKNRKIEREVEALLAAAMQDWAGTATSVVTQLRASNKGLQATIRDIKKKAASAERVTKALGKLDEVIERAGRLV